MVDFKEACTTFQFPRCVPHPYLSSQFPCPGTVFLTTKIASSPCRRFMEAVRTALEFLIMSPYASIPPLLRCAPELTTKVSNSSRTESSGIGR